MTRSISSSLTFPLILSLAATLAACGTSTTIIDDDIDDSTLLVVNDSDFVIEELYITDVDASGWGPNLLGADALFPGEEFRVVNIACGFYDVLLVDETGVECELLNVDLCFDDATWVIRNNTCTIFAAQSTPKDA
jgi:hypothetical protein